ncbi:molecular chaperone TorD family protein [Halalkaliarchaeum sp. AArc-GB]|uniref:TorD/DmsD family molecular chaperone n=1 Tax=Halalkaliarchaeum sp. AArc-GB TaxID=3074078 RepID=UPI00285C2721|nr:molecular chaperone TorD family protein [Halalkaliarchaeum sp. AArc-GB]MDR5672488.1 molecular chaperone TorD family protein [Halalkaliarchaeum sp. AArc-GB]
MNELSRDELLAEAERRGNAYKFLSVCYRLPDEEWRETMAAARNASIHPRLEELVGTTPPDRDDLRVDYAKLFVGPFEVLAPPYGSVYMEQHGRAMGESTLDVERRYREEGLDIGLDEPADHIVAELEFLYYLVVNEAEALRNDDLETAATYLEKQRSFLESHLGNWIGEFATNVAENATTEFYRTLGRETARFVDGDLNRIREQLERLDG